MCCWCLYFQRFALRLTFSCFTILTFLVMLFIMILVQVLMVLPSIPSLMELQIFVREKKIDAFGWLVHLESLASRNESHWCTRKCTLTTRHYEVPSYFWAKLSKFQCSMNTEWVTLFLFYWPRVTFVVSNRQNSTEIGHYLSWSISWNLTWQEDCWS